MALKKQISELKTVIKERDAEVEDLKKNYKYTRITELETDLKVYVEELIRMRNILEEVMKSKDPLSDPAQAIKIHNEEKNQKDMLKNVQKENHDLAEIIKTKDKQIEQQLIAIKEKDLKVDKLKIIVKESK